jgi:hypothetical protein
MQVNSLAPSPRVLVLTASTVLDADAIKTTIATVAAITTYTGVQLNGADVAAVTYIATPTPSGYTNVAQYPIAVAASNAGSYVNGSTIQFVGTYCGAAVTRTATVVGTDGNATFVADGPVDTVTSIIVAAQTNTSGAWTFGFNDVRCVRRGGEDEPWRELRSTSSGDCLVTCASGDDALLASLTATTQPERVSMVRLKFSSASTTVTTLRLYE